MLPVVHGRVPGAGAETQVRAPVGVEDLAAHVSAVVEPAGEARLLEGAAVDRRHRTRRHAGIDGGPVRLAAAQRRVVIPALGVALGPPERAHQVVDALGAVAGVGGEVDGPVVPQVHVGVRERIRAAVERRFVQLVVERVGKRDAVEVEAVDEAAAVGPPVVVGEGDVRPADGHGVAPVLVVRRIERAVHGMRVHRRHVIDDDPLHA